MRDPLPRPPRGLVPLLVLGGVVILVALGFARGIWTSNLHNGLLAIAFGAVGAYLATHRPTHRLGRLFVVTGGVEAVLFFGRQVGYAPASQADRWWAWLGVWPLAVALALATFAIICFPDGRLPSPRWRGVGVVVVVLASASATLSALWPVEYASTGAVAAHPLHADAPATVQTLWDVVAHPSYIVFQILWIVALATRWRGADPEVRVQLIVILLASALSLSALTVGLLAFGTHVPGVLTAVLVPVAGGWAIVHGRRIATYRALSWLSRTTAASDDLPDDMTRTTARALGVAGSTLWMGGPDRLALIGSWPPSDAAVPVSTLDALRSDSSRIVRVLSRDDRVLGALTVEVPQAAELTRADLRLLDDLAGQATWVLEHLTLARVVGERRRTGQLDGLTPREQEVIELMARGFTNRAICDELFLSIKTVEPIVSSIFSKLDLRAGGDGNQRVLAVLAYLQRRP